MGLASLIITATLTTFVMIGRSVRNIQNYSEIEANARKSLEYMSREIRAAYAVTNFSATSFTLSIPDATGTTPNLSSPYVAPNFNQDTTKGAYSVTYTYDSSTSSITRTGPPAYDPSGTSTTAAFVSNVQKIPNLTSNDVFNYFRLYTASVAGDPLGAGYVNGYNNNIASSVGEIQQIEVKFLIRETARTVVDATNKVLSARFILRNKR